LLLQCANRQFNPLLRKAIFLYKKGRGQRAEGIRRSIPFENPLGEQEGFAYVPKILGEKSKVSTQFYGIPLFLKGGRVQEYFGPTKSKISEYSLTKVTNED
jgi:hypothetical protein